MGHSKYPANWDQIRHAVYERDNHQCQECGAKNTELHAHHIIPLSKGGANNGSNLITLCAVCHSNVHGRPVGSLAMKKPKKRKWGSIKSHVIIALLSGWWTFGLSNLAWAFTARFINALKRN